MTQSSSGSQLPDAGQQPVQNLMRPVDLTPQELAAAATPGQTITQPAVLGQGVALSVLVPSSQGHPTPSHLPGETEARANAVGTQWFSNTHISALWGNNQDRNSWVLVENTGWVKLSTASDSGVVALTMLASYAKLSQHVVSCFKGNDGMIHEIYA